MSDVEILSETQSQIDAKEWDQYVLQSARPLILLTISLQCLC